MEEWQFSPNPAVSAGDASFDALLMTILSVTFFSRSGRGTVHLR